MDKTYDPQAIEQACYERWEREGHFAPSGNGTPYCIMIPPPNVTGSLHMGHAFQDTIMDALTRYHRMRGDNTLWQPGTDHAGIATQMVVERQLNADGLTRHDLGREAFIDRVWEWKGESGGTITQQLRRMGSSVDWAHERFTMDEGLSEAVRETFVQLYDEGLIYRGERLVNWDPVLHTAVSDLEVISEEENGHIWHIRYPYADGSGHLTVATTRPETMLGDTAVAVHPDDERFKSLLGHDIELPLTSRTIPVIADEYVDMEFGSGCVKITPAHDFNDYAVGERHDLPRINILNPDATINDNAPEAYRGLDRYEARKRVIADLEAAGLLEAVKPHRMAVPRGDRSQSVIEPYLTKQWFVRAKVLAEPSIAAVEDGRIRFIPENWSKTYFEWMRNIEDWCISRQIWWGHRIPAWYDADNNIYVGRTEAEVRDRHRLGPEVSLEQDPDVLDTWYSSALWPFSTLGWPQQTDRLQTWYPGSVLVTGFDIIFFWVARMIMMGMKFMGDVPFRDVYIHGLVRDADGNKMSKSKGNVLDPLDLIDGIELEALVQKRTTSLMQPDMAPGIEKATRRQFPDGIPAYGTDALRFTFCSLATTGRDIRFDLGRISGYRNFCNKLWNAARYVLSNADGQDCGATGGEMQLSMADNWIKSQLQSTVAEVTRAIDGYRFDLASQAIYEFVWNEYCDWYIELSKTVLNDENATKEALRGTRYTLVNTLEALLRLAHPLMPYITESIWRQAASQAGIAGDTVATQPFPLANDVHHDADAETQIGWLKGFVLAVRNIRGEMDVKPSRKIAVVLDRASPKDLANVSVYRAQIERLAGVDSIEPLDDGATAPEAATALLGEMRLLIPLAGLIDKHAERQRLEREISRHQADVKRTGAKLGNEKFIGRAPEEVVAKERARLEAAQRALTQLREQLERLERI